MKYEEIVNSLIRELSELFESMPKPDDGSRQDYRIVVCPERIFFDDYVPQEDKYANSLANSFNGLEPTATPQESPFKNTIFVVVKLGSGQKNNAVTGYSVNIQVMSEENDFLFSRELLDLFVNTYNFTFQDGMMHAYFPPEMTSSQETVYIGFRALYSLRGFVRVPEGGFLFVENVAVSWDNEDGSFSGNIPFISLMYHYAAQPDPQAFAGYAGETKAMNRQCTETITITTYLMYVPDDEAGSSTFLYSMFSKAVLKAKSNLNQNFGITLETMVPSMNLASNTFKLIGVDYSQEIANMSTVSLSFTASTEDE